MPEILLVISDGCLKAITTAIYSGNTIVLSPRIRRTITGQFVLTLSTTFLLSL